MNKIFIILVVFLLPSAIYAQNLNIIEGTDGTNKKIRNYIKDGNNAYKAEKLQDAYDFYQKALAIDNMSEVAQHNEAVIRLKMASLENDDSIRTKLGNRSIEIFKNLTNSKEPLISSIAYYNLGNIAFQNNQIDNAIEYYKNALRKNPNDDYARINLRYAQLQKEKNKNNKNKQDKEQKDDKQQKEQESEKNKQQQNKEQNQNKKQNQKQNIDSKKAEQILKSMENEEQATRRKIEARKKDEEQNSSRIITDKPW